MSGTRHASINRLLYFGCGRVAMTSRNTQSGPNEFFDHGRGHTFGSQSHNGAAANPETFDCSGIAPIRQAYLGFRMNALAGPVERRAFQMEAEHARNLQASLSDCS